MDVEAWGQRVDLEAQSAEGLDWELWQGFEPWGGGVQRIPWAQMQEDWEGERLQSGVGSWPV